MRTGTAATSCICVGFLMLGGLPSAAGLYAGTVIIALGNSLIFSVLMAMALSGARVRERASIISTFSSFFDLSSGLGGLTLGAVAAAAGYRASFASGAAYAAAGLGLLRLRGRAGAFSKHRELVTPD
jgi:predicted MFS family arabinose efflux permease